MTLNRYIYIYIFDRDLRQLFGVYFDITKKVYLLSFTK